MFKTISDRVRVACLCIVVPCAALSAASLLAPLTYPQMAEIVDDAVLVELPGPDDPAGPRTAMPPYLTPIAGNHPVATLGTYVVPDTP